MDEVVKAIKVVFWFMILVWFVAGTILSGLSFYTEVYSKFTFLWQMLAAPFWAVSITGFIGVSLWVIDRIAESIVEPAGLGSNEPYSDSTFDEP